LGYAQYAPNGGRCDVTGKLKNALFSMDYCRTKVTRGEDGEVVAQQEGATGKICRLGQINHDSEYGQKRDKLILEGFRNDGWG
jgi:hypothetical protein